MIDAWTDPSNPPTPQQFPRSYGPNDGITRLLDKIKGIQTELRDVRSHLPGSGGIGNAMLTSPTEGDVVFATATNFALAALSWATLKTATITVPAGMTGAAISIISRVYAINNNTTAGADTKGADWIYSRATVAGILGNAFPLLVGGFNGSGINVSPLALDLSGLTPGATFDITVQGMTGDQAFAANAVNMAEISGSVLWFR